MTGTSKRKKIIKIKNNMLCIHYACTQNEKDEGGGKSVVQMLGYCVEGHELKSQHCQSTTAAKNVLRIVLVTG